MTIISKIDMGNSTEIKILKGYQNTKIDCNNGLQIGQGGEPFNMLNIAETKEYCTIEHYATAISRSYRYLGNSKMTVAQHCVRGAECFLLLGDPKNAWNFLFHEVAEPLGVGDMSAPTKKLLNNACNGLIKKIEHGIEKVLSVEFMFDHPFPEVIGLIDKNLAQDEMNMMYHEDLNYDYWNPEKAHDQFMVMHRKLEIVLQYNKEKILNG